MTVPLQLLGATGIGQLFLVLVVPVLVIAFGSYVGVLMALQSFFDASSWQEATNGESTDDTDDGEV